MSGSIKLDGVNIFQTVNGIPSLSDFVGMGSTDYGFLQLKLSSDTPFAGPDVNTPIDMGVGTGDTTNITRPHDNHVYRLGIPGIYLISFNSSFSIGGEERYIWSQIHHVQYGYLSTAMTHIKQADSGTTFATATPVFCGYFNGLSDGTSDIYFAAAAGNDGNGVVAQLGTYATIVLIRRTG